MPIQIEKLLQMPHVATCNPYGILKNDLWDQLDKGVLARVHEQVVRAAGFVARDFQVGDDGITMLYGWQTHKGYWMDHLKPLYWRHVVFGQRRTEQAKAEYSNLGAALSLEHWVSGLKDKPSERRCPLMLAKLGPCKVGERERLSSHKLSELAADWNKRVPTLDTASGARVEAFFCFWEGQAYVLSVPFIHKRIKYNDVVAAFEEAAAAVCIPYMQEPTVSVPLWHIGDVRNYSPQKVAA